MPTAAARRALRVGAALGLATAIVFAPVGRFGFLGYDDAEYVTENPHVRHGLNVADAVWAFTHVHVANYHPVTWLSHMLDCTVFDLAPAGPHLENALLHGLNAALLVVALSGLTGALGRSALVAALFAVHPLRVESVAWIAERKDLLCGLGFMLTLIAYARWVAKPTAATALLGVASFVFGLLAKPMIVTLPVVLLALDGWPLGRLADRRALARCILEKTPLLALSALVGVITIHAQVAGRAVAYLSETGLGLRAANAVVAYAGYLAALAWPANLAVLYPFPAAVSGGALAAAAALLAVVSAGSLAVRREMPWVCVGWLWFVVMLLPVSGLAKVGQHASADRFTYLPSIGILVAVVWTVHAMATDPRRRRIAAAGAIAILVGLVLCTRRQLRFWQDDVSLWTRALAVTSRNCIAHANLGSALLARGSIAEGRSHFDEAIRLCPESAKAHTSLGIALDASGDPDGAMAEFDEGVRLDPADPIAWYDRAIVLAKLGRLDAAIASYRTAVRLDAEFGDAHANLAWTLAKVGRREEAVSEYRIAVRLLPGRADLGAQLAAALAGLGER